jgi:hypothetical protein
MRIWERNDSPGRKSALTGRSWLSTTARNSSSRLRKLPWKAPRVIPARAQISSSEARSKPFSAMMPAAASISAARVLCRFSPLGAPLPPAMSPLRSIPCSI